MQNIWSDNNAPELIPAGYVKSVPTHNLPVFSCVPQAQYINSLAIKFVTDFVLASKNPSDLPGFELKQLFSHWPSTPTTERPGKRELRRKFRRFRRSNGTPVPRRSLIRTSRPYITCSNPMISSFFNLFLFISEKKSFPILLLIMTYKTNDMIATDMDDIK